MNSNNKLFYECEYCLKKLTTQSRFDKHNCEKMKRHKLCKTLKGYNAFADYCYWLAKRGRKVSKIETFVDSKFFTSFIEFQEFANVNGIPDKNMFIDYMASISIMPTLWTNKMFLAMFIKYFDDTVSPIAKVKISIDLIERLAGLLECDISEVLTTLLPSEVSRLIFERRLTPWLLLHSQKFKGHVHMLDNTSQYVILTTVINPSEWADTFKKNPKAVKNIKLIVRELNL